jgi:hypothetical protein
MALQRALLEAIKEIFYRGSYCMYLNKVLQPLFKPINTYLCHGVAHRPAKMSNPITDV